MFAGDEGDGKKKGMLGQRNSMVSHRGMHRDQKVHSGPPQREHRGLVGSEGGWEGG